MEIFSAPIAAAMQRYSDDEVTPFHTPGHKQGRGAHELLRRLLTAEGLRQEVSLMDELDDLHAPHACIRDAQQLAARLWHADECLFMVNGTTSAIQAMMLGTLRDGDQIIIPRNAHRSVLSGLTLSGAVPVFLPVEFDAASNLPLNVTPETVRRAVNMFPQAKALLLVSPNYYGVAADVRKISDIVHAAGMLLLVDEAHGAHLPFSNELPPSAMEAGADAAALSTHKILGSLTQTSMLMLKRSADVERIKRAASLLQTTSPNQLLLASLDIARLQMQTDGRRLIQRAIDLSRRLRLAVNNLRGLKIFDVKNFSLDPTKVTVNVLGLGLTGHAAEEILRRRHLVQCELSDAANVLFLVTYADCDATISKLIEALSRLPSREPKNFLPPITATDITAASLSPRKIFAAPTETVALANAANRICAEEVTFYPPGIPLILPGEKISAATIDILRREKFSRIIGAHDPTLATVRVLQNFS